MSVASAGSAKPSAPVETRSFLIDEAKLAVELPPRWRLVRREVEDVSAIQYGFEREPVQGRGGHVARPYVGVIVKPLAPEERNDVIAFSTLCRARVPFEVIRVFTRRDGILGLQNAIGYRGRTQYEGNTHEIFVVHALFRDKGITIIMDTTTEVFQEVERELLQTLVSFRHVENP
ncbi:MAG: hypothetical protein HY898_21140 [Deltaproteobacteria bacterium]|nr:hypothetical protein [Deltaproteobacteria bacterium]